MLVQISIEKTQPLTGTASTGGKGPVSFVGWLDLLRAIAELADAPGQSVDPGREADAKPAKRKVGDHNLS
jgi:hypothetical protein